ncbi:hypothetical protein RRSWK_03356 [Rhodopirellula sp. SWK7]|nr:hypothetical protein RRSWK_03356 [Rhodopirellula sp. SWK7]
MLPQKPRTEIGCPAEVVLARICGTLQPFGFTIRRHKPFRLAALSASNRR